MEARRTSNHLPRRDVDNAGSSLQVSYTENCAQFAARYRVDHRFHVNISVESTSYQRGCSHADNNQEEETRREVQETSRKGAKIGEQNTVEGS